MDEYQRAKATINCVSVEYGVTAEVLKYVPIDEMVLHTSGELPKLRSTMIIVPVP